MPSVNLMKVTDEVYIVGSGNSGLGISNGYDCHVYLVDGGSELALIDSGVGLDTHRILENIAREGLSIERVSRILLTHAHADHSGGSAKLKAKTGARVALSVEEADFLSRGNEEELGLAFARRTGWYPPDYHLEPCPVDVALEDGQTVVIGDLELTAISTPGHSRGSVCYLMKGKDGKRCLFSGDTVFLQGYISLLNAPGSSVQSYREGIRKLAHLDINSLFPGHLGFCLDGGQGHIDKAIAAFEDLRIPKCIL